VVKPRRSQEEDLQEILYSPSPAQRRKKKARSAQKSSSVGEWTLFHVKFCAHFARVVAMLWFCISLSDFFAALPSYLLQRKPEFEQREPDSFRSELVDERNAQRRAGYITQRAVLKRAWLSPLRDTTVSLVLIAFSGSMAIFVRQHQ
jgi:hypothetical protein